eukprot:CAMPEP_0197665628 /NCGR_PEP_ID=MMETSP1338-20131121/59840_1 /TAXON_ID=43686 ORGANISM="Pelagodinium beii, Strain RCC1491" /NCGR_SAMPLE_ID=MMETSP1338 /ASSEMBLY_ACC=CAM_ASM_000754 /LENGTH=235 /DNA_ID=CAMNT_0043244485 /DNA_START=56 /DNA_END=763 /DNA_ORIENTATION=-
MVSTGEVMVMTLKRPLTCADAAGKRDAAAWARFLTQWNTKEAAKLFDSVRGHPSSKQQVTFVFHAAALADGKVLEAVQQKLTLLGSYEKASDQGGSSTTTETSPGASFTIALNEIMDSSEHEAASAMVRNLISHELNQDVYKILCDSASQIYVRIKTLGKVTQFTTAVKELGTCTVLSAMQHHQRVSADSALKDSKKRRAESVLHMGELQNMLEMCSPALSQGPVEQQLESQRLF